jgi:hypothetical protein
MDLQEREGEGKGKGSRDGIRGMTRLKRRLVQRGEWFGQRTLLVNPEIAVHLILLTPVQIYQQEK